MSQEIRQARESELAHKGLQGYLRASFAEIEEALGEPNRATGYKSQVEWAVVIDGAVVTIYDWHKDEAPEDVTRWNVGGDRGALDALAALFGDDVVEEARKPNNPAPFARAVRRPGE